jgi:hypothetical protein
MRETIRLTLLLSGLLSGLAVGLYACGMTPQSLGITGPGTEETLLHPPENADATNQVPGVASSDERYAPSVHTGAATAGRFYGE